MLYPTWKLNSHWTISGAVQVHSRPLFAEEFETQGYGVKGDLLQLNLSYARFWSRNRSMVVARGQLSSAFGAFLQRYDAADNPLIGVRPPTAITTTVTFQAWWAHRWTPRRQARTRRAQFVELLSRESEKYFPTTINTATGRWARPIPFGRAFESVFGFLRSIS